MVIDSISYLGLGDALATIKVSFNRTDRKKKIDADPGRHRRGHPLRLPHPVLRNISLMMMLFNLTNVTLYAQGVLYAKERLHANNFELGLFFASGSVGAIVFSLLAGRLQQAVLVQHCRHRLPALSGVATIVFAAIPWFWAALPLLFLRDGLVSLLNINTFSLRQVIVPDHMLGRVLSVAGVLAFSALPIGSLVGALPHRAHAQRRAGLWRHRRAADPDPAGFASPRSATPTATCRNRSQRQALTPPPDLPTRWGGTPS